MLVAPSLVLASTARSRTASPRSGARRGSDGTTARCVMMCKTNAGVPGLREPSLEIRHFVTFSVLRDRSCFLSAPRFLSGVGCGGAKPPETVCSVPGCRPSYGEYKLAKPCQADLTPVSNPIDLHMVLVYQCPPYCRFVCECMLCCGSSMLACMMCKNLSYHTLEERGLGYAAKSNPMRRGPRSSLCLSHDGLKHLLL